MSPLTMNHRPSTILPSVSLLAILMLASLSQAQGLMLDKCLDDLAEKGSLGPVVAVMHPPVAGTPDLSSLEGLAKTFGLKLFEQEGIHVLGPAECLYLYDLSPYFPKERPKQAISPQDRFFDSLAPEQLRVLGTRRGLGFYDLSEEQQSLVRAMFTGRITLRVQTGEPGPEEEVYDAVPNVPTEMPPPEGDADSTSSVEEAPPTEIPEYYPAYFKDVDLSSLPIEELTITGSLVYGGETSSTSVDFSCCLPTVEDAPGDASESVLDVEPEPASVQPEPPKPFGPNVLKPSQLDYERSELQKQAQFETRTSLRDVVGVAARESGLPLVVGPGSEQVLLYVNAGSQSMGQVLKAVSLATCGTWRQVGDLFVYTLDIIGLGTFERRALDLNDIMWAAEENVEPQFNALRVREVMLNLPLADGSLFSLTPQQTVGLTAGLAENPTRDACRIPGRALTLEQRAVALSDCEGLKATRPDQLYLDLRVSAELKFHFQAAGNAEIGYMPAKLGWFSELLPPDEPQYSPEFEPRVWPRGSKIPMPSGTRGLLYRLAKSDTPASVVTSAAKYGFNTLLLRIFAAGCTLFPSAEFPQLPGLNSDDFLRNLIAIAHSRGIKVVGVIDVLRLSNGDKKHWLYKTPEIIDRDIAGRMNTEWMAQRIVNLEESMQERIGYGDAFDGDFVSPFQPMVRQKLSALVGELATHDLDGLAFDHTAIIYPSGWDESERLGQTGFDDMARSGFIRSRGIDPIDITYYGIEGDLLAVPMAPVAAGAASQEETWDAFYRTACDALLDILVEDVRRGKPGVPVWVVDTYRESLTTETVESHDWRKFEGRIDTVVGWGSIDQPDYAGEGIKTIQLVRVTDSVDPLHVASFITLLQNKTFPGMLSQDEVISPPETPIEDIVLDFPCSEARRSEFLKLLETARPVKTR